MPASERRRLLGQRCPIKAPALFLDRDGVIIKDMHHIADESLVRLHTGAKGLISQATANGFPVVVITNQSGIARGYFDWQKYELITDRMIHLLGPNCQISGIYANGYGPEAPKDSWRKPSPAMLIAAAQDLNLDLGHSIMVGDRLTDIVAGARAGVRSLVHVKTGHGETERHKVARWSQSLTSASMHNQPTDLVAIDSLLQFPSLIFSRNSANA